MMRLPLTDGACLLMPEESVARLRVRFVGVRANPGAVFLLPYIMCAVPRGTLKMALVSVIWELELWGVLVNCPPG